jgi:flagellar protein FliO/FliZ
VGADLLRVVISLGVVLGLLWVAARLLRRTSVVRGTSAVEVLARAQLARNASLAVVRVADRALVLGVGDGRVALVAEADLQTVRSALATPAKETRQSVTIRPVIAEAGVQADNPAARGGPLAGSALSPTTWRTAIEQLRMRTARRA